MTAGGYLALFRHITVGASECLTANVELLQAQLLRVDPGGQPSSRACTSRRPSIIRVHVQLRN